MRRPVVALIGGVGSGKTSIARKFAQKHKGFVIDADGIGHEILEDNSIKEQIQKTFGTEVFDACGAVDRQKLAKRVFGEENDSTRRLLEKIVHPRIRQEILEKIEEARADSNIHVILLDAAVVLETGWANICDFIVFVDTPVSARENRVRENRNWVVSELQKREQSQWPLERKRAAADAIIENSETLEDSVLQLENIVESWVST